MKTEYEGSGDFFGIEVPLMKTLGLIVESIDATTARARLPITPHILNSRGHVHGGTLMSVLDFTMSAAARGHSPLDVDVLTIEMSTHFIEPAKDNLIIEAKVLRRGRKMAFCEGEIRDSAENQVCVARATFKLNPLNR